MKINSKLPNEWQFVKIRYIADTQIGVAGAATGHYVYNKQEGVPLVRNGNIKFNEIIEDKMVYVSKEFAMSQTSKIIDAGDIVTAHTGAIGAAAIVPKELDKCLGFSILRIKPRKHIVNSEYLCWYINSDMFKRQYTGYDTGDGRRNLNVYDLDNSYVCLPPMDEQLRIANFLNDYTKKIDKACSLTSEELNLLYSKKKLLIRETLIHGVTPYSETKESSIDGIGEIPISFNEIQLRYLVTRSITDGTHQTPEYTDEKNGTPFLSSKDINSNNEIDWRQAKHITNRIHKVLNAELSPQRDDILLTKNGTIGKAALVNTDKVFDLYLTLALIRPDKNKIIPKYLLYALTSSISKEQFDKTVIGISIKSLLLKDLSETKIIVPPMDEQLRIVQYLDNQCTIMDKLIQKKEKLLKYLKTQKESVLYECMSGQYRIPE